MMSCKHEFIGNAEGVKCALCGAKLTTEEYREYLKTGEKSKPEEKPKTTTKKTTAKKASKK